MNGLIETIKRYLKKVVLASITTKYKDEGLEGRLQYLNELIDLINKAELITKVRKIDTSETLSTKFIDIKVYSRNVVNVVQTLQANQNIDFYIVKSDALPKSMMSFMLTHDSRYIDPKEHVETILQYSVKIQDYVLHCPDKQSTTYIHNTYLLLYYVEDLITFIRELVRISSR